MRTLAISALLLALFACSGRSPAEEPTATTGGQGEEANPYNVVYKGTDGPGVGRHIVLIAGDHEYRSEEILPAMGRLLAKRFGFKCSIFFTLDDEGFIEPGSSDIEGLVALETADLFVAGLRFQDFAAAEMQHVVDYLDRGGPVLGIRTADDRDDSRRDGGVSSAGRQSSRERPARVRDRHARGGAGECQHAGGRPARDWPST